MRRHDNDDKPADAAVANHIAATDVEHGEDVSAAPAASAKSYRYGGTCTHNCRDNGVVA